MIITTLHDNRRRTVTAWLIIHSGSVNYYFYEFKLHSLFILYKIIKQHIMLLVLQSFLVIFQVTCCNKISSSYYYYVGQGHQRPNIFLPTRAGCDGDSASTFCDQDDKYPSEYVKNIMENLSEEQRVVFLSNTKKILGVESQKMDFHHAGFASHPHSGPQETPVCKTEKRTHYPVKARTWNNEER